MTSEGRLSGVLLSALPFILFLMISWLSPNYFDALKGTALLIPTVVIGLFLLVLGNFVIYRMVNFKV